MAQKIGPRLHKTSTFSFHDKVTLNMRIGETQLWCVEYGIRQNYRSPSLQPSFLGSDRFATIESVARRRSTLLKRNAAKSENSSFGGRLVSIFIDESHTDGVADKATNGFFDLYDIPPWDTWIAMGHSHRTNDATKETFLLAWVPSEFISRVDDAIGASVSSSIVWTDTTPTDIV